MLPKNVYNDRLENCCKRCEFWHRMRCRKGHVISSTTGCPVRKFPPIHGADYDQDREPHPLEEEMSDCCGYSRTMQDMSWAQVAAQFAKAMAKWARAGLPRVSAAVHGQRQVPCATCPHRQGYWCGKCKCLIYLKTKLATEQCPDDPPRWRAF